MMLLPKRRDFAVAKVDTLQVAVLFNRCYELMLVLLLYLYGSAVAIRSGRSNSPTLSSSR